MSPKFLFTTLISATVALGIILFGLRRDKGQRKAHNCNGDSATPRLGHAVYA